MQSLGRVWPGPSGAVPAGVEQFVARFCDEYDLDAGRVWSGSRLVDDLGFDSVDVFDTVLFVEELAGVDTSSNGGSYPLLETVGGAYAYLCELTEVTT